jgi:hypothetical protein
VLVGLALAALIGPRAIEVFAGDDAGIHEFFLQQQPRHARAAAPVHSLAPTPVYRYAPADGLSGSALRAIERASTSSAVKPLPVDRSALKATKPVMIEGAAASHYSPMGARAVCVRLCDGYHFPLGAVDGRASVEAQSGMCESLCPGAPARLFVMPGGSEKIEDATSRDGRKYSSLPVAFRHASTRDKTCSCRPGGADDMSPVMSLLRDLTLRRGDGVMTAQGVKVFRGSARWPLRDRDFLALSDGDVSRERRSAFDALTKTRGKQPSSKSVKQKDQAAFELPKIEGEKIVRIVGPQIGAVSTH